MFLNYNNVDRPNKIHDFITEDSVVEKLRVFLESSKKRGATPEHVLFYGPPGLGKTTLARIIATELNRNIKSVSAPAITKTKDLAAILTALEVGDVFFIDELHRLPIAVEEMLYSAMEDYFLEIVIGEGVGARSVRVNLNAFTLVGATTRLGLLSAPLKDRFGLLLRLDFYTTDSLVKIIQSIAKQMHAVISVESALEIANRARGTPRIAKRILKRVMDYVITSKESFEINDVNDVHEINNIQNGIHNTHVIHITHPITLFALQELAINASGLDAMDYAYLNCIARVYNGGPVGIETIAASIEEEPITIKQFIEPYLIRNGLIEITNRGRITTIKCTAVLSEYFSK